MEKEEGERRKKWRVEMEDGAKEVYYRSSTMVVVVVVMEIVVVVW